MLRCGTAFCGTVCRQNDLSLLQRIETINQERGSNGDVEGSAVNVTVSSRSVKWMKIYDYTTTV